MKCLASVYLRTFSYDLALLSSFVIGKLSPGEAVEFYSEYAIPNAVYSRMLNSGECRIKFSHKRDELCAEGH